MQDREEKAASFSLFRVATAKFLSSTALQHERAAHASYLFPSCLSALRPSVPPAASGPLPAGAASNRRRRRTHPSVGATSKCETSASPVTGPPQVPRGHIRIGAHGVLARRPPVHHDENCPGYGILSPFGRGQEHMGSLSSGCSCICCE